MILVDTSIIVAWLEPDHEFHRECSAALTHWASDDVGDQLAVSNITYAELASGGRTQQSVDEDLVRFKRLLLDWDSSFRAGQAFRRWGRLTRRRIKDHDPVLPDFFIRAQAAVRGYGHLTNDRRRLEAFPDVEFLFP